MELYEIPPLMSNAITNYIVPILSQMGRTTSDINWGGVIKYAAIYYAFLIFLSIFLVVFFDDRVLKNFFSVESREYAKPLVFYVFVLWIIRIINIRTHYTALFVESFFIILIVKFVGLVDTKTGKNILRIVGGFALIELILSPIGNLDKIEPTLVVSLLFIVVPLMVLFYYKTYREKIEYIFKKITTIIIEKLIKEEAQII